MMGNKPGMYFITIGRIDKSKFPASYIKNSMLSSTPRGAIIKYMYRQYDTHLSGNRLFILSDEYSSNLYNYRINLYKVDQSYLNFLSQYPDTSRVIYTKINDSVSHEDAVSEINADEVVFLKELMYKYDMDVILTNSDNLLEVSTKQFDIGIDKINDFISDIDPEESFIRPIIKPEAVNNPVAWSHDMIIGEYDVSETVHLNGTDAKDILYNLNKFISKDINESYYVEVNELSTGYGVIRIKRKDIVQEGSTNKNLWNLMMESSDISCGINYNIKDLYYSNIVECIDITEDVKRLPNRQVLSESRKVYGGEYSPIYIVLTDTGSLVAKVIKRVTSSPYNHVSISLNPDLQTLYSFTPVSEFKKSGFTIEGINKTYLDKKNDISTQIYAVFVNQNQFRKVNMYINSLLANYKKSGYNFIGILGYILNKPMERENKKFCSEFVDEIFKLVDMDITHKKSGLVKPYDFSNSSVSTIFKVYEGSMSDINTNRISSILSNIFANNKSIISEDAFIYNEAKSFPVQFDEDGNMFIRNMKKLNYQSEYEDSHRLLGLYEKGKNIEGIKFELSKMWFLNSLIEEELYSRRRPTQNRSKELINIRARVLNDFHRYLTFIDNNSRNFNFSEYYEDTPFSDAEIKIHRDTINGIGKIVKSMIRV